MDIIQEITQGEQQKEEGGQQAPDYKQFLMEVAG